VLVETRTLGASDLLVSVAGLGCNNFGMRLDDDTSVEVVRAAFDAGITFFDTARVYGGGRSESLVAAGLRGHRDEVVVGTKFGAPSADDELPGSRASLMSSVEASLRELETDRIDLLQYHRPDPRTPIEETLSALHELVRDGKVRYIGCSNFTGWQIADAHWVANTAAHTPFVSLQNQWSLFARDIETEVVGACERFGLGILPYYPLASGMLTGKVRVGTEPPEGSRLRQEFHAKFDTDERREAVERIDAWARARGRTVHDVALSYLASNPVTGSVIAGATSPEQVRANVAATRTDLSADERAEIVAVVQG
jgi:aryl-alcohol dehydrogenase-like predicted oxidoreductase